MTALILAAKSALKWSHEHLLGRHRLAIIVALAALSWGIFYLLFLLVTTIF
jgi:hypothetical protein